MFINKKAFSLIELLYSLIILSLLTAFSAPLYKEKLYNSMVITTKENLLAIINKQHEYYNKNDWYDTLAATTVTTFNGVKAVNGTTFYAETNNIIETRPVRCVNGTLGLYAKIVEPRLIGSPTKDNYFKYDSCLDTKMVRPDKI